MNRSATERALFFVVLLLFMGPLSLLYVHECRENPTQEELYGCFFCFVLKSFHLDGDNERLFTGETLGNMAVLVHTKNFRDLSRDSYLEVGLSGLLGWKDEWHVDSGGTLVPESDALPTVVLGTDVTYVWEPADRALYRNLEWRSEAFWLRRSLLAPEGTGRDTLSAWGAFSYVQTRIDFGLNVGFRVDFFKPDDKAWTWKCGFPPSSTSRRTRRCAAERPGLWRFPTTCRSWKNRNCCPRRWETSMWRGILTSRAALSACGRRRRTSPSA